MSYRNQLQFKNSRYNDLYQRCWYRYLCNRSSSNTQKDIHCKSYHCYRCMILSCERWDSGRCWLWKHKKTGILSLLSLAESVLWRLLSSWETLSLLIRNKNYESNKKRHFQGCIFWFLHHYLLLPWVSICSRKILFWSKIPRNKNYKYPNHQKCH